MITALSELSYEDKWKQFKWTILETRTMRGEQIEAFKMKHGFEGLDKSEFF